MLLIGVAAAAIYGVYWYTHRGPSDHSAAIQASIGAQSCSSSGYLIKSRIDGSEQIVYDCVMPSGVSKCVTESGGIASDETAIVRLLFANALSRGKPSCLG